MSIKINKNGKEYDLGFMPEHYPADRVYLDGDTTKTVQDAIDELNGKIISGVFLVTVQIGINVISSGNISGTLPTNHAKAVYLIVNHSLSRSSKDIISCDSTDILINTDIAQTLTVRWFRFDV